MHCSAEVRVWIWRRKVLLRIISWGDFLEYGAQAIFEGMMTSEPQMPNVSQLLQRIASEDAIATEENASAHLH